MFENPSFIIKLIGISSVVVYLIFRFQVVSLIISTFFSKGRNRNDEKISAKVNEYLEKHNSKLEDDNTLKPSSK